MALLHVAVGIETFGILSHYDEIKGAEGVAHAGIGPRGAQIGEQIEILPEIFRGIDLARALVLENRLSQSARGSGRRHCERFPTSPAERSHRIFAGLRDRPHVLRFERSIESARKPRAGHCVSPPQSPARCRHPTVTRYA